jgi:hypothetical protein
MQTIEQICPLIFFRCQRFYTSYLRRFRGIVSALGIAIIQIILMSLLSGQHKHTQRRIFQMRQLWILFFLILVTGCSKNTQKSFGPSEQAKMSAVFDPAPAAYVLKPGTATLKGEVSATGRDGLPHKGKFANIRLIPETAYAGEYIDNLFRGKTVYRWGSTVLNVDKRFLKSMRHAQADKNGNYTFFGVPAGSYYVYAIAPLQKDYFAVYKRATIAKGQMLELALNDK